MKIISNWWQLRKFHLQTKNEIKTKIKLNKRKKILNKEKKLIWFEIQANILKKIKKMLKIHQLISKFTQKKLKQTKKHTKLVNKDQEGAVFKEIRNI